MAPDDRPELTDIHNLLECLIRILVYRELETDFQRNSRLRDLFDMTGRLSHTQIQKRLHLSPNDITAQWVSWRNRGLILKTGKGYRKLWRD